MDWKRLFRLTDNNIHLALGSGSARGLAHLGVIRALEERGYTIAKIAGCSAGAMVAAYYAMGMLDKFEDYISGMNNRFKTILNFDLNLKGPGLVSGKKLFELFDEHLEGAQFEDARIPLIINATDITTGEEVVFRSGSIAEALRASISIPGLFKPYSHSGHCLVDGAVVNPVPVNALGGGKRIVAVDLNHHLGPMENGGAPGIWQTMRRSVNILSRQMTIYALQAEPVWKLVQPDLSDIQLLDYHRGDEIIQRGYDTMRSLL